MFFLFSSPPVLRPPLLSCAMISISILISTSASIYISAFLHPSLSLSSHLHLHLRLSFAFSIFVLTSLVGLSNSPPCHISLCSLSSFLFSCIPVYSEIGSYPVSTTAFPARFVNNLSRLLRRATATASFVDTKWRQQDRVTTIYFENCLRNHDRNHVW